MSKQSLICTFICTDLWEVIHISHIALQISIIDNTIRPSFEIISLRWLRTAFTPEMNQLQKTVFVRRSQFVILI